MFPNYLILTPDGVGSTYLQRALTVYLNCAGIDYWNTHELLNGLVLDNNNLRKDFALQYTQSISQICKLLCDSKNLLVSRIAQYHIQQRLETQVEDYDQLYDVCNKKYNQILYCTRDPFEYALSWSIRHNTNILNVYSITERIDIHSEDAKQTIDLDYFNRKLLQYGRYEYWAKDNFDVTGEVKYEDLHKDVDSVLKDITGLAHTVEDKVGISLQNYSLIRYTTSLYKQTLDKNHIQHLDRYKVKGCLNLNQIVDNLIQTNHLVNGVPVKMNTLLDKQKRITNFDHAVDVYNNWAITTNDHSTLSKEIITNRIAEEQTIYVT